jgi:hypothetical protein
MPVLIDNVENERDWGCESSVSDKRCTKCGEVKPLASFTLSKSKRTGKTYPKSWCRSCCVAQARAYQQRNPVRTREYQRSYRQTERAKAASRAGNKRYRETPAGAEKIRAYRRRWAQTERGRAALLRAQLKWLAKNPDSSFTGMVSLNAPSGIRGTLLDCIADSVAVNPLERLIQSEAVVEVAKRVVSERGCSWVEAIAIVEAHV